MCKKKIGEPSLAIKHTEATEAGERSNESFDPLNYSGDSETGEAIQKDDETDKYHDSPEQALSSRNSRNSLSAVSKWVQRFEDYSL